MFAHDLEVLAFSRSQRELRAPFTSLTLFAGLRASFSSLALVVGLQRVVLLGIRWPAMQWGPLLLLLLLPLLLVAVLLSSSLLAPASSVPAATVATAQEKRETHQGAGGVLFRAPASPGELTSELLDAKRRREAVEGSSGTSDQSSSWEKSKQKQANSESAGQVEYSVHGEGAASRDDPLEHEPLKKGVEVHRQDRWLRKGIGHRQEQTDGDPASVTSGMRQLLKPTLGDPLHKGLVGADSSGANMLWRERQERVSVAFRHAWRGYKEYAFGADELLPLSHRGMDGLGSLGATVVDALDTAMLMGHADIVRDAGDWVVTTLPQKLATAGQVLQGHLHPVSREAVFGERHFTVLCVLDCHAQLSGQAGGCWTA